MTLKIRDEQAIKMNRGGGKGGRNKGEGCRIHADVSRKRKEEVALRGEGGGTNKGGEDIKGREDGK